MQHAPFLHRAGRTALAVLVSMLSFAASATAYDARVAWSPVAGSSGYKIYVSANGAAFGAGTDVGVPAPGADGAIRWVLTDLNESATARFAVTSYNGARVESGLSNQIDLTYAQIAARVDSDGDGLTDAQEDRDLDMVVDAGETDPNRADSDGDGVSDAVEVTQGSNPLDPNDRTSHVATPTSTRTATATPTPTRTPTVTATATRTAAPLPTPTSTSTKTSTPLPTATRTATPLPTATQTSMPLPTATGTATPLPTVTRTSTPVPTATRTSTPVPTVTPTVTRTAAPIPTETATTTPVPTETATSLATATVAPTASETPTPDTATATPEPTASATATTTPTTTATTTASPTATSTVTGIRTATPVRTATATRTPTTTATPTRTATPLRTATTTPVSTATVTRTATPIPTRTPLPTVAMTPAPDDRTLDGAIIARVPIATGTGNKNLEVIRDGDLPPAGTVDASRQYDTYDGKNRADDDWIGYAFSSPITFSSVLFQEGMLFPRGGWFESLTVHVRRNGLWTSVAALRVTPEYPGVNDGTSFTTYTFTFTPIVGDAIRIWGRPGGRDEFVSIGELRVFSGTGTPPATVKGTPTSTKTPTATSTPTSVPTRVPTIAATATVVVAPTIVPTALPTAVATPEPALCGNGVRDADEQCDGEDAGGCPARCLADCSCAGSFTFPLDGWVPQKGGSRSVSPSDPDAGGARVLVVEDTAGANSGVAYPERPTLELPFPILSFTSRAAAKSEVQVTVRGSDGRNYVLTYAAAEGVPTAGKHQSTFPVGMPPTGFRTTLRDLAADLNAAFNVEFASVGQVTLRGAMRVADVTVAAPGVFPATPVRASEIALPAGGWLQQGSGTVVENEYDAELAAPTIRTEPRDSKRARIAVTFPKKEMLAAAYRTLSLVVRDEQKLAIEVRVRVRDGIARLRYEAGLPAPVVKGRKTTLPLTTTAIDGSAYRLVTIDLATDLARVIPRADLSGVLGVRVQGKFRMGDVVLREPIE